MTTRDAGRSDQPAPAVTEQAIDYSDEVTPEQIAVIDRHLAPLKLNSRRWRSIYGRAWCLLFGVALLSAATNSPSHAQHLADGASGTHGIGHAENHDWYQLLKQPGSNASCCNKLTPDGEGDCRPVIATLGDDGIWVANVDGRPVKIPPSRVLRHIAPDGNAHICMSPAGTVFCFIESQPKG